MAKAFEVVLKGFDGGTDETDHLVLWIWCPEDRLQTHLEGLDVESVGALPKDISPEKTGWEGFDLIDQLPEKLYE